MSAAVSKAWTAQKGCVIVRVRVTPKSSKDAVEGLEETADGLALRVRVRAVPSDGAANDVTRKLLAGWLGIAGSRVSQASGLKSRIKSFAVAGDVHELDALLARKTAHAAL